MKNTAGEQDPKILELSTGRGQATLFMASRVLYLQASLKFHKKAIGIVHNGI